MKLVLTIHEVENGYVVFDGSVNGPQFIEPKWVAATLTDLLSVIDLLARKAKEVP